MASIQTARAVVACLTAAGLFWGGQALAQGKASHLYMSHVTSAWNDTPGGAGLLPVAEAEADIALRHAQLAAERPGDVTWMRRHIGHVLHAIDPESAPAGPGRGYGLIRAAMAIQAHIKRAAGAADASDAVKLHARYVARSAANAAGRGGKIVILGRRVLSARHAGEAARSVAAIRDLCRAIRAGLDADNDGHVSGKDGEGGLAQARWHMTFMMRAEGLR